MRTGGKSTKDMMLKVTKRTRKLLELRMIVCPLVMTGSSMSNLGRYIFVEKWGAGINN